MKANKKDQDRPQIPWWRVLEEVVAADPQNTALVFDPPKNKKKKARP